MLIFSLRLMILFLLAICVSKFWVFCIHVFKHKCMHVCLCVSVGAHEGIGGGHWILELELQVVLSHLTWMLATDLPGPLEEQKVLNF